jgi:hypothetical protein
LADHPQSTSGRIRPPGYPEKWRFTIIRRAIVPTHRELR